MNLLAEAPRRLYLPITRCQSGSSDCLNTAILV